MTEQAEHANSAGETASGEFAFAIRSRPKGMRRFFRFNLLTLLVALLLVTLYFGVRQRFVVSVDEIRAKRELSELGASYTLSPAYPVWMQYAFLQFGEDAQHVTFVGFLPHLRSVPPIPVKWLTAEDLAPLTRLASLQEVNLWGARFEGEALATLRRCAKLKTLNLGSNLLDDTAIERLAGHPTIEAIDISRTLTTDAALKTLAQLPNLREITLDDAATAEGLAALAKAKRLEKIDASGTALRSEDLQVFVDRGLEIKIHRDDYRPPQVAYDEAFWFAHRDSSFVAVEAERLTDREFLDGLARTPSVYTVNVHGDDPIDPEALAGLLSNERILEIYLDVRGAPIPYAAIEAIALRVRPADATPCIVYGNVTITGEELVYECAKVRNAKRRPTAPIYAPYVIVDLQPEHIERLNELANSTEVRVQPHAPGPPLFWALQSAALEELSPVFVMIPTP